MRVNLFPPVGFSLLLPQVVNLSSSTHLKNRCYRQFNRDPAPGGELLLAGSGPAADSNGACGCSLVPHTSTFCQSSGFSVPRSVFCTSL